MDTLEQIRTELRVARGKYEKFHSCHEGFAVLKEEVDELWDEIKRCKFNSGNERIRAEAIQVAAMAVRLIEDLC